MGKSENNGMGFLSVLTLIFIVLKCTDNIDWSWWWVLAPTWIPVALFVVVAIFFFVIHIWTTKK